MTHDLKCWGRRNEWMGAMLRRHFEFVGYWICIYVQVYVYFIFMIYLFLIYQVWTGKCMCVFPDISPLLLNRMYCHWTYSGHSEQENVIEAKDQQHRPGCFYPCGIISLWRAAFLHFNNYHNKVLINQSVIQAKIKQEVTDAILFITSLLKP